MPNHVMNILSVKGKSKKQVLEAIKSEYSPVDFNKILPMPTELKGTCSPAHIVSEQDYEAEVQKAKDLAAKNPFFGLSLPLTQKLHDELIAKYGHAEWYGWSCKNWGTKWNAYSIRTKRGGKISFQTAWSTPVPVIKALSRTFPDVEICVEFADEDIGNNTGIYICRAGEILTGDRSTDYNDEACKFAKSVWRKGKNGQAVPDKDEE